MEYTEATVCQIEEIGCVEITENLKENLSIRITG